MGKFFQTVSALMLHPSTEFRRSTITRSFGIPLFVLFISLVSAWVHVWSIRHHIYTGNIRLFLIHAGIFSAFAAFGIVLLAALLHLCADLLSGAGRGLNLMLLIMLATLPFWLLGPFAVVLNILLAMQGFYTIILYLIFIWSIILVILAVKELYRFSLSRAIAVCIMPPVFIGSGAYLLLQIMMRFLPI